MGVIRGVQAARLEEKFFKFKKWLQPGGMPTTPEVALKPINELKELFFQTGSLNIPRVMTTVNRGGVEN